MVLRLKKQLRRFFVMTVAVLGLATAVTAQVEDNTHQPYKGFSWGYCTYYAAQVFDRFAAAEGGIDWRGNGGMWLRAAQEKGWQTSTNPRDARVGAIIVWQNDGRGHVGVVDDVYPDGILISEMNWRVNSDGDATGGFNRISQSFLPFSTNLDRGVRRRYFLPDSSSRKGRQRRAKAFPRRTHVGGAARFGRWMPFRGRVSSARAAPRATRPGIRRFSGLEPSPPGTGVFLSFPQPARLG